jgi:hypothetical protein
MSKSSMIKKYIKQDLPGGKELLDGYLWLGIFLSGFIISTIGLIGTLVINNIFTSVIGRNLSIQQQEFLNETLGLIDYCLWSFVILILISVLGIIVCYYNFNNADKIYRKAVEKGYPSLQIEKSQTIPLRVDADQLRAQKLRISDFLSKLDERFINKEIGDQNYKELKVKYETQLKDTEKQIVDAELHE